jgi:hypothetical protein
MRKDTFVISAFPACGKSYCFRNHQDEFSMLDSDSSEFSWLKDERDNNTKVRNPEFPSNYIQHIKENIGKVDMIFVSSHEVVRKALYDNGINVIIIYPNKDLKEEWIRRFKERGNDEGFINFLSNNWDNFIDDIEREDYKFLKQRLNSENSYLDLNFLYSCFDNSMGNLTCMWFN